MKNLCTGDRMKAAVSEPCGSRKKPTSTKAPICGISSPLCPEHIFCAVIKVLSFKALYCGKKSVNTTKCMKVNHVQLVYFIWVEWLRFRTARSIKYYIQAILDKGKRGEKWAWQKFQFFCFNSSANRGWFYLNTYCWQQKEAVSSGYDQRSEKGSIPLEFFFQLLFLSNCYHTSIFLFYLVSLYIVELWTLVRCRSQNSTTK